ncbi:MAG: acyl-CoA dehydrogenase C-terminal domain-containing protein, partial [Pseudomonadales bacterium]
YAATPEARSAANKLVGLLTPIAKGWSTEVAQEITYHGVQIHGGMGFVEETGAAQYQRDARILPIYEGTTGIQALDLVGRKTLGDGGAGMASLIAIMRADVSEYGQGLSQLQLDTMVAGIDALEQAYQKLLSESAEDPMLPGAISYDLLMLAGYVCGGWQMMRASVLVASHDNQDFAANKQATSAYYLEHLLPRFKGHLASIEVGSESLMSIAPEAM